MTGLERQLEILQAVNSRIQDCIDLAKDILKQAKPKKPKAKRK